MNCKLINETLEKQRLSTEISTKQVLVYINEMILNKSINGKWSEGTSYGLKHQIERFYQRLTGDNHVYCSNNRVKFALLLLGCQVRRIDFVKVDICNYEDIILDNTINLEYRKPKRFESRRFELSILNLE